VCEQVGSAFGVRAKTIARRLWAFVEVRGEVNDRIVVGDARSVVRVENVKPGAARKIVGLEETAHMDAEITAATRDENFHRFQIFPNYVQPLNPLRLTSSFCAFARKAVRAKAQSQNLRRKGRRKGIRQGKLTVPLRLHF
jgi:hypothetical protein